MGTSEPAAELQTQGEASGFESVYRANVGSLAAFFARRCSEPQVVADLTSQTFVEAIGSMATFDARLGSVRAWLFGIARHVYAEHCADSARAHQLVQHLGSQLVLSDDEIDELAGRIDDQAAGRRLLKRCAHLPELDRTAIELVDLAGLTPTEAARALQVSPGVMRVRLFRARARLRKGAL